MADFPETVVLVAVKHRVLALNRVTGERLWERDLTSGWTGEFVTLTADTERVYAHCGGKLACLDLRTGSVLWQDELKGLGHGIASLVLPGVPPGVSASASASVAQEQQNSANALSTMMISSS